MKSVSIGQQFHHYKCMGANYRHSRKSNTEVNSPIWPKFELIRECMAVLATYKFDEDPIKIEGIIDRTRSNMGFRLTRTSNSKVKGLIWPKFELIREFMAVLVNCKFDDDPINIEFTIDRTRSNMGSFSTQRQVTLSWIVWCGWKSNSSDIMAVLVTWKIGEDWIKTEVAIFWTTLSPL